MSRLALALTGLSMLHPAHAATASGPTPTYVQQANRVCQTFFTQNHPLDAIDTLSRGRWPRARRRAAAQLRHAARVSLRTDDRLAAIAHPASVDARWRRMIANDRAGARVLLATARRVAAAPTRKAAIRVLVRGYDRYAVFESRFNRAATRLHLACTGPDPEADLGPDPTATPAQRAAAAAFGAAAQRLRDAIVQQAPTIRHDVTAASSASCDRRILRGAPPRVRRRTALLVDLSIVEALFGPIQPAFARFAADLDAVQTTDPALVAGRALFDRYTSEIATLPSTPVDVCAALKAWRARHWAPAAAPRVPTSLLRSESAADQARDDRVSFALARRLRELGVPVAQIDYLVGDTLFDGVLPDEEAGS